MQTISLPKGLTAIGDYAFFSCKKLQKITVPSGVTSIGRNAFSHCTSLQKISLPKSLTTLGYLAFSRCEKLKSVTLPANLTIPDGYPSWFNECTNLQVVYCSRQQQEKLKSKYPELTYKRPQ